jgi:hypothetical protein
VAAKLTLSDFPDHDVRIVYCDTSSEHPDNARFLADCAKWYDHEIEQIKSEKYEDIWDVFEKTRWLVGPAGARCTTELKKNVRRAYERPDDIQVFGFDSSEQDRADRFRDNNIEIDLRTPLLDRHLSKADCADIVLRAGIEVPEMYRLGYRNANCIGCPKGGSGYWNLVRTTHPEVFSRMAKVERDLDVSIIRQHTGDGDRVRVFLDELDPDAGHYASEPALECGLLCGVQEELFGEKA